MEENHYYPYGLKHTNYNTDQKEYGKSEQGEQVLLKAPPGGNDTVNEVYKYKFNGMEYQDELGLNMYDMDMRDYDPATARWTGIDPVTHFEQSPYMAMNGNPVLFADPSGADGIGGEVWSQSFGSIYSTPYNGAGANFSGQYGGSIKPVESLGVGTGVIRVGGPIFWGSLSSQSNQTYEAQILRNNYSTTNKAAIKRIYNHFARAYGYPVSRPNFRVDVESICLGQVDNDYQSATDTKWSIDGLNNLLVTGSVYLESLKTISHENSGIIYKYGSAEFSAAELTIQNSARMTNIARGANILGHVAGGIGLGLSIYQYGANQISGTEALIDTTMGVVGFIPGGAAISLGYFAGKALYEYATGETLFVKPQ